MRHTGVLGLSDSCAPWRWARTWLAWVHQANAAECAAAVTNLSRTSRHSLHNYCVLFNYHLILCSWWFVCCVSASWGRRGTDVLLLSANN